MHSTPHTKRIPRKSVNRFLFVRFSQVQKLLSSVSTGLKNTPQTVAFCPIKRHTASALLTRCYNSRGAYVSVVSAFRAHFLTIINNYPVFSKTLFVRFVRFVQFVRFVRFVQSIDSFPLFPLGFGGKVINYKPNSQTIWKKSFIKNCKRTNKAFSCVKKRPMYMCVYARVTALKCTAKKFCKKVVKKFGR